MVGADCDVRGSYVQRNVTIHDGARVTSAFLCEDVVVHAGAVVVGKGAVLSYGGVVVGAGHVVADYARLSLATQPARDEDEHDSDEDGLEGAACPATGGARAWAEVREGRGLAAAGARLRLGRRPRLRDCGDVGGGLGVPPDGPRARGAASRRDRARRAWTTRASRWWSAEGGWRGRRRASVAPPRERPEEPVAFFRGAPGRVSRGRRVRREASQTFLVVRGSTATPKRTRWWLQAEDGGEPHVR